MSIKQIFINLIIIVLFPKTIFSQEKSIAIYNEGNGYLQPFIERTLDSLKNSETNDYLFKTTNLNRLKLQNQIEAERSKLLQIYINPTNNQFDLTSSEKLAMSEINLQIQKNDYLLIVKTITLVELIEFQFELLKPIKSKNKDSNTSYAKLIASEDIFINPKNEDYKLEIINTIKRLFKKTNNKPRARLNYLNKDLKTNDTIIVPLGTLVTISGKQSGDIDTEKLSYIWRNIYPLGKDIQNSKKINLNEGKINQNIKLEEEGLYKIGFKVYDGVENSNEFILNIKTTNRPKKLTFIDTLVYSEQNSTFLDRFFRNPARRSSSYYLENDTIEANELIISTEKLGLSLNKKNQKEKLFNDASLDIYNTLDNPIRYIKINSEFNSINNKKKYYVYSKDKNHFLSQPQILNHNYRRFFFASITSYISSNSVSKYRNFDFYEDAENNNRLTDSTEITENFISQRIAFNFNIVKNFQFSITIPTNTKTVEYKDYRFEIPAYFSYSLRYTNNDESYSKNEKIRFSDIRLTYNTYSTKDNIENDSEFSRGHSFLNYHSIGGNLGAKTKILRTNFIHVEFLFEFGGYIFLGKLQDLAEFEASAGINFKFNSW